MIDWITPAISLIKSVHPDYETVYVPGDGRTPNEAAKQQGKGWKVGGFWDNDDEFGEAGCIVLHRKKKP